MKKKVLVIVGALTGGVLTSLSQVSSALLEKGYSIEVIVVQQDRKDVGKDELFLLDNRVHLLFTKDYEIKENKKKKFCLVQYSNAIIRIQELFHFTVSQKMIVKKEYGKHLYRKVEALKDIFGKTEECTIIAMGTHAIWCTLLAVENQKKYKVILYELSDPQVQASSRTFCAFVKVLYPKANAMVFETKAAMLWYTKYIKINGYVIYNFLRKDLPDAYHGNRKKIVVNFCRISREKNLKLLIEAFDIFSKTHNDYKLYIYGNSNQPDVTGAYYFELQKLIKMLGQEEKVKIFPARNDILSVIKDYSIFVSSSDFEGLSNSMIEALAIGLPTISTDLEPAKEIIKNNDNGILVPVGDAAGMAAAMSAIADNAGLQERLSLMGSRIREHLADEKLVNQWIKVIEGLDA